MYSASCLEARELGAAWMRAVPEIPLLLHRLKLTSCFCPLLPLLRPHSACCCLVPGPVLPRHPSSYPRNPKAKFASNCWRRVLAWFWGTLVLSLTVSPPQGKGEHLQRRLGNLSCVALNDLGDLIKGGGKCHSSPLGLVGSPHIVPPSVSHLRPSSN